MRILLFAAAALLALPALAALAAFFAILRDPAAAARRFESLFRRPGKAAKPPEPDHYYKPYWS